MPPFIDTDIEDNSTNSMCNPTGAPLPTDFQDVELGETSSVVSGAEESTQPLMKPPRSSSASVASVTSTQSTPFEAKHHDKHDAGLGSAILDRLHPTHQMGMVKQKTRDLVATHLSAPEPCYSLALCCVWRQKSI